MMNSVDRYVAPKLTVYGSMVKLTASGTLGSCENGNSGQSNNCNNGNVINGQKRM